MASVLSVPRLRLLGVAFAVSIGGGPAFAQEVDHSMHLPPASSPATKTAAEKPVSKKPAADPHAGHAMPAAPVPAPSAEDHAAMGHAPPVAQDPAPPLDHAAMGHGTPMPESQPREPIPVVTEADRIAAFPDVAGHGAHDQTVHSYWLLDRLESWDADEGRGIGWEALAWVGTDLNRAWLRSEGEQVDVDTESAEVEVLYGRSVDRWWDVVAGVRHDFGEGPSQTFAAIGVMGLAPQKFEVEATAYFGQSGQTAARVEAEYDTLLTNRLILQWQAEAEFHGKDDARRGIGSGLSTVEAGLRLRYEFTRQFAPYLGVVWERGYGGTAGFRRAAGEDVEETKVVVGVRVWF
ncbi:copper resistance protein B [Lysobacter koreensis]|uniref:Copper resistance protein B n=1 Tax=Lysobacter koreensis TaxID=266122 RepID=A0ABW2YIN4_9GAMM